MKLTKEEMKELQVLKNAILENPASVHWDKMERYGDLMVKSLFESQDQLTKPQSTSKIKE